MNLTYPFSQAESQQAAETWGANCGPNALAFALQVPLESVRLAIPGFEQKRYTSPSMMRAALQTLGAGYEVFATDKAAMFKERPSLVRVQWDGPWCQAGSNPRWAYRQTHWVVGWEEAERNLIFDCNGGIMLASQWEHEIIPLLIPPRGNGKWFPTHVWRLGDCEVQP